MITGAVVITGAVMTGVVMTGLVVPGTGVVVTGVVVATGVVDDGADLPEELVLRVWAWAWACVLKRRPMSSAAAAARRPHDMDIPMLAFVDDGSRLVGVGTVGVGAVGGGGGWGSSEVCSWEVGKAWLVLEAEVWLVLGLVLGWARWVGRGAILAVLLRSSREGVARNPDTVLVMEGSWLLRCLLDREIFRSVALKEKLDCRVESEGAGSEPTPPLAARPCLFNTGILDFVAPLSPVGVVSL